MSKKSQFKFIIFYLSILVVFYFAFFVLVPASLAGDITLNLQQPFGTLQRAFKIDAESIARYINAIYIFGSAAVAVFAIVMIMLGGIEWITAAGNPEKIGRARSRILKALLGLFLAVFAVFILQTVSPRTVSFEALTGITPIAEGVCCKKGDIYGWVDTRAACEGAGGTTAAASECIGHAALPAGQPDTCSACSATEFCNSAGVCQTKLGDDGVCIGMTWEAKEIRDAAQLLGIPDN